MAPKGARRSLKTRPTACSPATVPATRRDAFHEETALWFQAVGDVVRDLRHPEGPIVLVQIDNEGALYFRDGPYDQDYHPDAIALFRAFLRDEVPRT